MERIIKITLFLYLLFSLPCLADEVSSITSLVTPQNINYNICSKEFNMPSEKLFYLTISSISANKFKIEEIQSKTGYILFTAANKQYLASIVKINGNKTLLKITPTNNAYFFQPGIVLNIFKYIDLNTTASPISIPKV